MDNSIIVQGISKKFKVEREHHAAATLGGAFWNFVKRLPEKLLGKFSEEVVWALSDVSFKVKEGEALGILGANGAGKSSLLKIIARITVPTSGKIELYGSVASLLEVGTGFHLDLTGRENIYMNGTLLGMRKREVNQRLDEIISFSEVEDFIDIPLKKYSTGMRLRLAFAVVSHLNADILLIDEVLAVGDLAFQKKCIDKMNEIIKQGRTILYISHNLDSIRNLCRRSIYLADGKVILESNTPETIQAYLDRENIGQTGLTKELKTTSRSLSAVIK